MLISKLFFPVLREVSADAKLKSHQLMLKAGMIRQSAAGIYSWLPLGLKVLKKIEQVVREEQDNVGAQEMLMPTIQSADIWKESGRYDDYGQEMLRIKDRSDRELLYGPTNEELITEIFRDNVKSYKSLPLILYHIQWKFRDEIRPRFGVMRCRDFLMKDSYSFDLPKEDAHNTYNKMFNQFSKNNINVLSEENSMIHVSGHPGREELKKMYQWVKPKIMIPVHGEERHMTEHISFAKEMGVKYPIKTSNGEIVRLAPGEPKVVDKVTWGRIYLDGKVLIDNDSPVLKERRNMAANGYMEITVLISKNGQIKNNPVITLKGIPLIEEDASEIEYDLEDIVMNTCKTFNLNNSKQEKNLIDTLKGNCRKLINDKSGKKPLVNINLVRF